VRRRLTALAFASALVAAPVAAAQRPEVVVGTGSYNNAPVLEPGTYSDTVRGAETNVYAVDLEPGQQIRAQVKVDSRGFEGIGGIVMLKGQIDTPSRAPTLDKFGGVSFTSRTIALRLTGPQAQEPLSAFGEESFVASGRWYLRVTIDDPNEEVGPVEFPLELELDVTGTPTGESEPPVAPEPEPTDEEPEPSEEPEPTEDGPAADDGDDDASESHVGTLALIGVGGGILGGLAGATLATVRRTRDI